MLEVWSHKFYLGTVLRSAAAECCRGGNAGGGPAGRGPATPTRGGI